MEYEYVVKYNPELKKWSIDADFDSWFPNTSVRESHDLNTKEGRILALHKSFDYPMLKKIREIVDTFPIPQEA